mmetsp:Transcript_18823/g.33306  ORF Transcript_18823/g.33306 Transcript_18823/m.33306 type:complete len:210 (+) Transcript_18823:155-784(+)
MPGARSLETRDSQAVHQVWIHIACPSPVPNGLQPPQEGRSLPYLQPAGPRSGGLHQIRACHIQTEGGSPAGQAEGKCSQGPGEDVEGKGACREEGAANKGEGCGSERATKEGCRASRGESRCQAPGAIKAAEGLVKEERGPQEDYCWGQEAEVTYPGRLSGESPMLTGWCGLQDRQGFRADPECQASRLGLLAGYMKRTSRQVHCNLEW